MMGKTESPSTVIRHRPGTLRALRQEARSVGLHGYTSLCKEKLQKELNRKAQKLNKSDLKSRGWTESKIAELLGEPDSTRGNWQYSSTASIKLYRRSRVELAEASPEFQAWYSRKRKRPPAKQTIIAAHPRPNFAEQWTNWLDALPTACERLFQLNRYVKCIALGAFTRQETYAVKNRMIKLLYRRGHCSTCYLHARRMSEQTCRGCYGSGERWDDGTLCWKCGGNGIYSPARVVQYYCFRFLIGEVHYCWHQPVEIIDFNVAVTAETQDWIERAEPQPTELSFIQAQESLDFLNWFLRQSEESGADPSRVG